MKTKQNKTESDSMKWWLKNIYLLFIGIVFLASCSKDKEPQPGLDYTSASTVIGKSINIELRSSEGINLLGSDEFPISEISATYLVNGKIVQNNSPHDYPNNVLFYNKNQGVQLFLNDSSTEEFPITYIKWNKTETDTIKAQYKRTNNSITLDKLWIFENNNWKEINSKPVTIIK
jgi:hypothetical protein